MTRSFWEALNNGINFVFPKSCLHCNDPSDSYFCLGCAAHFELIDSASRCHYCFAENTGNRPCPDCVRKKRWHFPIASALDYEGAVQTLVKKMKYGQMPYLAKTAAAFMFLQWESLRWDPPDLIVPVPRRLWFQGANHAALLGQALALHLNVKMVPLVGREAGDFSQARLTQKQRERLIRAHIYLRKKEKVKGKKILIVDDVMTTGTTLRYTAEALKEGVPQKLSALTLARALY